MTTMDARLLAASNLAYAVEADSTISQALPHCADYLQLSGLQQGDLRAIARGADGIDAALVGACGDDLVVAFRGTIPPWPIEPQTARPIIEDWLHNAECIPIPVSWASGHVHAGFADALDWLWKRLHDELQSRLAAHPFRQVLLTGHSKGGALAYLAAARMEASDHFQVPIVIRTFEAARPGDDTFARSLEARGIDMARYEFGDDIVPHLPPTPILRTVLDRFDASLAARLDSAGYAWGYASVGPLRYLRSRGSAPQGDSATLMLERDTWLAEALLQGSFTPLTHHDIRIGSGLFQSLVP